jgi:hypothetical protein
VPVPTHSVPAAVATATAPAPVAAPSPAPTKSSSPTNTSTTTNTVTTTATAPTTVDDSPSSSTPSIVEPTAHMPEEHRPGLAITTQDLHFPGSGGSPPSEVSIPTRESNSLEMPQPSPNPQIMAPIPPSPEMHRAVLAPQEPMVPPPPPPTAPVEHTGKLRKENPDARRRSGSLQHIANGGEPPVQGLKKRTTSPAPDRGRRSSSVQSPTVRNSNSKSRVVSTPLSIRPSSSKGDVSQSPTRGRLRRSWLPGGRSRSNSVEVSNANDSSAWVLSDDTRAEYNVSLLKNGEKVGCIVPCCTSVSELIIVSTRSPSSGTRAELCSFTCTPRVAAVDRRSRSRNLPLARPTSSMNSSRQSEKRPPVEAELGALVAVIA